jgi:hypothetical protein
MEKRPSRVSWIVALDPAPADGDALHTTPAASADEPARRLLMSSALAATAAFRSRCLTAAGYSAMT